MSGIPGSSRIWISTIEPWRDTEHTIRNGDRKSPTRGLKRCDCTAESAPGQCISGCVGVLQRIMCLAFGRIIERGKQNRRADGEYSPMMRAESDWEIFCPLCRCQPFVLHNFQHLVIGWRFGSDIHAVTTSGSG